MIGETAPVRRRVLAAEFLHETNTFQKTPTTIDNFKKQIWLPTSEEVYSSFTNTKSSYGATFEVASQYNWELTATVSASANPSGKIADETFEHICNLITSPLLSTQHEPFDGVVLFLHGAMVTASYEDAEGELLTRIRSIESYKNVPIIVTLDLHGNITEKMAANANALIAVRTYPHIDFYERAIDACELLQKCMQGLVRPLTVIAKVPVLPPRGLDGGRTQQGPMRELIDRGEILERDINNSILVVSICAGFSASDIFEIGPSVTVTVDLSKTKNLNEEKVQINFAQRTARRFINHAWRNRDYTSVCHKDIEESITIAREYCSAYESADADKKKPLVMADVTDNPGSGHYGDATNFLQALIDSGLSNVLFYAIFDAEAARTCAAIGVGNEGQVELGGNHDPMVGGAPLSVTGKVVTISDGKFPSFGPMGGGVWQNFGLSALLRVGGVDVIIISNNGQLLDLAQITSLGVDPIHKAVIAVKSNHHFRACTGPIAAQIVTLDGGGLGSAILKGTGVYANVRRPIYPLDKDCQVDTDEDD